MSKAIIILVMVVGLIPDVFAQESPDPSQIYIQRLTYAGPGCPNGTVAHNLADDGQAFTLLFDSFTAEVGPGLPPARARNSCRVTVDIRFPSGWSYSIFTVDYRGFLSLDANVRATQTSSYFFQASSNSARTLTATKWGPINDDYFLRNTLALSDVNWSPCGRNRAMNIDTSIILDNSRAPRNSGYIALDSIDGELTHVYGIAWRRCD